MTDAPERIWRVAPWIPSQYVHGLASWPVKEQAGDGATEYIRADIAEARERAAVAAKVQEIAERVTPLLSQYIADDVLPCYDIESEVYLVDPEADQANAAFVDHAIRAISDTDALAEYVEMVIAEERERCAKIVAPKRPRPCDCEGCYCGNVGDAETVAQWDADNASAAAIAKGPTDG
jgi:hypothetical protein